MFDVGRGATNARAADTHLLPASMETQVRLVAVPSEAFRATARALWQLPTRLAWGDNSNHLTVLVGQTRELSAALRVTAVLLIKLFNELFVTALTPLQPDGVEVPPGTLALAGGADGVREAANVLVTIDAMAMAAGSLWLTFPPDALKLIAWLADEVESQANGDPPAAYRSDAGAPVPPCHLLRAATAEAVRPLLHAYHHTGLTRSEVIQIRASDVAACVAVQPGMTLDELFRRVVASRVSVLDGIGALIEMGAIFGIGHRWYPYDIAVAALHGDAAANRGCECP